MSTPTAVRLVQEGDGETGVVDLGFHQWAWQCARCDTDADADGTTHSDPQLAQESLDEHRCVEDACPECATGVLVTTGRMERDTGHYPFACDAGCGYSG